MKKIALHIIDIMITIIIFLFMISGYILYFILYPFYRINNMKKIIFIIVIFFLIAVTIFYYNSQKQKSVKPAPVQESIIIIDKGYSLSKVSYLLSKYGLIKYPLAFKMLAILKGKTKHIKAGRYKLKNNMSMQEILDLIVKGNIYSNSITIHEGLTSWQIASLASNKMEIDSVTFMKLVKDISFIRSLGLNTGSLEGYLFPDTYKLKWNAAASDLIKKMVKRFNEVYSEIYIKNDITRTYSKHQIVTMASIIEGEATVDKERKLISGVFYNRLRINMPLGADPTVRYLLKKFKEPLTRSDLRSKSPYNTRINKGLPPGPINNPGKASLLAAINPQKTKMLYFVAKNDGSNEHYFSGTNKEHNMFKKKARLNKKTR